MGEMPEERGEAGLPVCWFYSSYGERAAGGETRTGRAVVTWTMTETGQTFPCLFFH